jgi:epoxyqueuosine reductase
MTVLEKTELIKRLSKTLGFEACGIAKAKELSENAENLKTWLDNGFQANMHWMENHFEKRIDPTNLVENAKSVIVLLKNYYPENYPFKNKKIKIARYALGEDYHSVIKKKLKTFLKKLNTDIGPVNGRYFVDSAPVLERSLAIEAGLGWIGKNSILINQKLGSYCFIAELIVDIELEYDQSVKNLCGTCTVCIDACPTGAILQPYIIDSNKCISYHTIENKDDIPGDIRNNQNGWVFGCDICQEVCPWNKKAKSHNEPAFMPNEKLKTLSENDLQNLSENDFKEIFQKSAVKRAGYIKLKRNIENLNLE